MKQQPNYYAILTAEVRYNDKISSSAKLLYAEITSLSSAEGYCWASNKYFSNLYGVSSRAIQKQLKELSDHGYIYVEISKKEGNFRKIYLTNKSSLPNEKKFASPNEQKFAHNNKEENSKNNIDYNGYLDLLNKHSKRSMRVFSSAAKKKLNARLKEGYTENDFRNTIINSCLDPYHIETKFKYVTFDYLTRPQTLDKYAFVTDNKPKTEINKDEYFR